MSKSLDNHIELAATPEETAKRIMSAVTDPARQRRNDPGHPEICNIYSLHQFFNPEETTQIAADCRSAAIGCVQCKKRLAEKINAALAPLRARRAELAARPDYLTEVLGEGARQATVLARETLGEVKEKMGLL